MEQPLLLQWATNRILKGFAPIILIVGKQRMGKTCTALRLAYEMDNKFDVDKQMFFEIIDFAKAVRKYNDKILILDEAGIELDTYRYSDARQRCFSHVVQSQAYKHNTLIVVLPHSSDLARCHRKYVDALVVIPSRGKAIIYKPTIQYWDMNDIDIRTKKIEIIHDIPLPPAELFNQYKAKYEKQIKEGILEDEIVKLDKVLNRNLQVKPQGYISPFSPYAPKIQPALPILNEHSIQPSHN
jgi:hypothetical protein